MADIFKIGEFSKNLGVTQDLITYYEEQGVITPFVDEVNHYRSYSFRQTRQIYEAEKYRNLGFSIKEAATLINEDSKETIREKLKVKKEQLQKQQYILDHQLAYIDDQLLKMEHSNTSFYIIDTKPMYFFTHSSFHDFNEDSDTKEALKIWKSYLPIVKAASLIRKPQDPTSKEAWDHSELVHGFICDKDICEYLQLPTGDFTELIPGRRSLVYLSKRSRTILGPVAPFSDDMIPLLNRNIGTISGDALRIFEYFSNENDMCTLNFTAYIPID